MRSLKRIVTLILIASLLSFPLSSSGEVFVSDDDVVYTDGTQPQVDILNQGNTLTLNVTGSISLIQGDTFELSATQLSEADAVGMTWESTEADIVSVEPSERDSRTATLTAVAPGVAIVNARTVGGLSTSLSVTVAKAVKPDSVALNYTGEQTINLGDTLQLEAILAPNTARTTLKWSTKNKKIATVDENGLVTSVREGTTTISVRTANKKTASVKVKVVDPYKPTSVALNPDELTVNIGDTAVLTPVLAPLEARTVYTWSTSSKKIAKVNENGVVTGIKTGTCTITVRTANKKTAKCKVTVVDNKRPNAVRFDAESVVLEKGATAQLKALLTPDTARTNLTWKTSGKKIVKVDSEGVITCVKAGKATITVSTSNKLSASIDIEVVDRLEDADTAVNGWIWPVHATVTVDNAIFMDDMYVVTGDSVLFRWDADGSVSGYYLYIDHGTGDTAETVFKAENVLEKELQIKRSDIVPGDEYTFDLGVTPLAGDSIDMSWTHIRFIFSNSAAEAETPEATVLPTATQPPLPEDNVTAATEGTQMEAAGTEEEEGLVFDDDLIW